MMKQFLLSLGAVCTCLFAFAQGVKVEIQLDADGEYQLYRDGDPYFIKGAAYSGHFLDSLAEYGGNSIRTYSTDSSTLELLDKADSLGLTVTLGLYVKRERDFFNFNDTAAVNAQLEDFRNYVKMYRNHPAVLMWSIGNEADAGYTNYRLWDAVNDIAEMIHEEDTLHPTMTVLSSAHEDDIDNINSRAASIDVLGVNVYKSLDNLGANLASYGWSKPYIVTEWGVDGTWQTSETDWNAPIELSSTSKAYIYRTRYDSYIGGNPVGQCIGSYVFVWGHQNHGEVESWFSLFTVNGESTEVVEAMQYKWTGSYPSQRAPRITEMELNGQDENDDIALNPGGINWATVEAYDPNSDSLTYEWLVVEEGYDLDDASGGQSLPGLSGFIEFQDEDSITFKTPEAKGAYRLYVLVHDGNEKVALMNIPFQVENRIEMLEDYEERHNLVLVSSVGTYSQEINPDKAGLNLTDSVGKYVAPGTDPYDKFIFNSGVIIEDAGKFVSGDFVIRAELWTDAPINTSLQLNFENASAFGSYPDGRHSVYKTSVPVQNQWSTITFGFHNTPDTSIGDNLVDQLTFAFDAGNTSSYIYYLDNLRIEKIQEDLLSAGEVYENYEETSQITFSSASGTYSVISNIWNSGYNKTDSTAMYIRNSGATYDGLTFINEAIDDASLFESEEEVIAINLYTSAPVGTLMEVQLRKDSLVGSYPSGRHSIYQARVLKQNEWHRLTFNHTTSPDSSVPDDEVDLMVFLMSPGQATSDTFYIDNIRSIRVNEVQPDLPEPWQNMDIGAVNNTGSTVDKYSGAVFVVKGSGENIWGASDEFQYAYQPISGDGEIICMIPSISRDVDTYMKAGLMFRETLSANAKHTMVYCSPDSSNAFQYRSTTGGSCIKNSDPSSIDRWLKLKRVGDVFSAYQSNDGEVWGFLGNCTISMSEDIFVGLAVTSHDSTKLGEATFRDISITSSGAGNRQAKNDLTHAAIKNPVIYPNPLQSDYNIYLEGYERIEVNLLSIDGRVIESFELIGEGGYFKSKMPDIKPGVYVISINSGNRIWRRLIIKE